VKQKIHGVEGLKRERKIVLEVDEYKRKDERRKKDQRDSSRDKSPIK
jgi:hypothetical protein